MLVLEDLSMSQSRIVSVVIVLAAALLFVPLLTAQAVISAGSTDTSVDQIFTLPVSIADASDVYAFQFDLAFDPSILQLLSISEGSFLPSAGSTFFIPGDIDNIGGDAISNADTLVGDIPGATGDGDLVDFMFQAINPGISSLSLSNGLLFDSSFNDIPFTTRDGSESSAELVKVARSNVGLATQALSDTRDRFAAGVDDNLPVVQAQATLAGAQSRLIATEFQLNQAKLSLARNTGVVETQYKQYLGR